MIFRTFINVGDCIVFEVHFMKPGIDQPYDGILARLFLFLQLKALVVLKCRSVLWSHRYIEADLFGNKAAVDPMASSFLVGVGCPMLDD
jgi:hypothetical protein